MKKLILIFGLFGILNSLNAQWHEHTDTLSLNDTVYVWNSIDDYQVEKDGHGWTLAFDFTEVATGCADAVCEPGSIVFDNYFSPFTDSRIPYIIALSDTGLQPDATQKVIISWFIDQCEAMDIGIRLDQGSCPDTLEIPVYLIMTVD